MRKFSWIATRKWWKWICVAHFPAPLSEKTENNFSLQRLHISYNYCTRAVKIVQLMYTGWTDCTTIVHELYRLYNYLQGLCRLYNHSTRAVQIAQPLYTGCAQCRTTVHGLYKLNNHCRRAVQIVQALHTTRIVRIVKKYSFLCNSGLGSALNSKAVFVNKPVSDRLVSGLAILRMFFPTIYLTRPEKTFV